MTSIWPGWVDDRPLVITGDVALIRLFLADLCHRLLTDAPLPGVPANTPTRPAEPLVLSSDPPAMEAALRGYGVTDVPVVPLPKAAAKDWEALEQVIAASDLVLLDDVSLNGTVVRETAMLYLRCIMNDRQRLVVGMGSVYKRLSLPVDGVHAGVTLTEDGRVVLGQRHVVGRRSPQVLIADVVGGRIEWMDAAVVWRREYLQRQAS